MRAVVQHASRKPSWVGTTIVLVLPALVSSACVSKKIALHTIDSLDTAVRNHHATGRELRKELAVNYLTEAKRRMQAEIRKRGAEIALEIYKRSEVRAAASIDAEVDKVEGALEGPITELKTQLDQVRAQGASRDLARERELRAALGGYLAGLAVESRQVRERIRSGIEARRNAALEQLTQQIETALLLPEINFDPNDEAARVLKEYEQTEDAYLETVSDGFEQLRRYTKQDELAIKNFTDGLGLGSFGEMLAKTGQSLIDKGVSRANEKLDDLAK